MGRKLHCGFVGYGRNGWVHLLELKWLPMLRGRTEIVGIMDPNSERQKKIEQKNLPLVTTLEEMIDIPSIEALFINSPPQYHVDQVVAGLEAGLHVFSEVPMALSKEGIERIIQAEEESGKKYQFGENYIFFAEVLYASHLVKMGKIGPTVYAEAEYLHDITYRWRQEGTGGPETPRINSWYENFDPLMYAHSIGPAQVALGGLSSPMPFIEVSSYANDIGGYQGNPICSPAKAFQVALFRTNTGAIAKCANAYKFAREPTRMGIQVVGRTGTYEAPQYGRSGRLFLAEDHIINKRQHRKGKISRVGRYKLRKIANHGLHPYLWATGRVIADWLDSIDHNTQPKLHAKVAANMTMAGIAASQSFKENKPIEIPLFN